MTALFLRRTGPSLRRLALSCAALAALCACGCVQRRITIRSNPPGALVYIDKYEIGKTPCSVSHIYYGTREIKLIKDGFETLTVMQWMPPPWYQIPPLDFISENVVPAEIRDERTYSYQLVPTRVVPTNQLLGRAENLRQATRLENAAAAAAMPPVQPRPRLLAPPPLGPAVGPPVQGGGILTPPGMQPPGVYPPAGIYPPLEVLPTPGPLPPRGPQ